MGFVWIVSSDKASRWPQHETISVCSTKEKAIEKANKFMKEETKKQRGSSLWERGEDGDYMEWSHVYFNDNNIRVLLKHLVVIDKHESE